MPALVFSPPFERIGGGGAVVPTTATLAGSNAATTGVAHTSRVTLDQPADQTYIVTWARSNSGTGPATSNITAGQTYVEADSAWGAAGSGRTVDFTISPSLTRAGRPLSVTVSDAVPGTVAPLTLTSATVDAAVPFVLGHAFKQGDIPAGYAITVSGATARASILSTWPDGSARFAVVGGTYPSAGSAVNVTLAAGSVTPGSALTGASLQTAMGANTAVVDAGAFGSAPFSGADFASPFVTQFATDYCARFIYRKQIGSDAHLVAWLEVTLWASGAVEVLPWVENGYINVAGPTNKSATYGFSLGGSSRFSAAIDLKHHQRLVLVSGTALSHWLGTDPGVVPRHDPAYLMATEMVPTYRANTPAGSFRVAAQPTSYTPLQQGSFFYSGDDMYGTGYQEPIGLLPEHDVLYLTAAAADAATVYRSVVWNGYGAGRYSIFYRDETTNRAPRMDAYPTLVYGGGGSSTSTYCPTPTGGGGPAFDVAHHPSIGYMAYLVTGRWYFMDLAQTVATTIHYVKGDNMRSQTSGLVQSVLGAWQTRAAAWQWRSLLTAAAITPTGDALASEFKRVVQANIDHYHGRYAGQTNNVFGIIEPGEEDSNPPGQGNVRMWMQDFFSASTGWGRALALNLDAGYQTKLAAFHDWNAQGAINRLGTTAWPYINAIAYNVMVSPSGRPDYVTGAGPFYTVAEAYANTSFGPLQGSTADVLAMDWPESTPSYWHNLQPAISYAVRFGVSGALTAYGRLVSAKNWALGLPTMNLKPVWAVKPASGVLPAWVTAPVGQWAQITGTTAPNDLKDFCGVATRIESDRVEVWQGASGGHSGNLSDNTVRSIRLEADAPAWATLRAASSTAGWDTTGATSRYMPDGRPAPAHTYWGQHWVPEIARFVNFGAFAVGSGAGYGLQVDGFNPATGDWDAAGTWPSLPNTYYVTARDPATGNLYALQGANVLTVNPATLTTTLTGLSGGTAQRGGQCWDSARSRIYHLCSGDNFSGGSSTITSLLCNPVTGACQVISFNASAAYTAFLAAAPSFLTTAIVYDPTSDLYYFYSGHAGTTQTVYVITPNAGTTWDMSTLTVSGVTPAVSIGTPTPGGVMSKFFLVDRWRLLVLVVPSQNIYYLRLA